MALASQKCNTIRKFRKLKETIGKGIQVKTESSVLQSIQELQLEKKEFHVVSFEEYIRLNNWTTSQEHYE
jgi:ABC-type metal ion transport system substrate-binding protein